MTSPVLLHATCVALGERALLIAGPSGSGKSDLALRLIDRGARLVSDDQVLLTVRDGQVFAAPPATIAGKIEVRGIGIVAMPYRTDMPIALLIELSSHVDRMPEPATRRLAGVDLPLIALTPFEASAAIKAELACKAFGL